jgi:prolyl oligopeptidase
LRGQLRAPRTPPTQAAPPSDRNVVTDTYHGMQVLDPYRRLEDSADPKVHDWSAAQNRRTRQYLDALPLRDRTYRQLLTQISATSSSYHGLYAAGGQVFALYDEPPKQQPMISVLTNAAHPAFARVIVDPNAMNPQGTTAIDWFVILQPTGDPE